MDDAERQQVLDWLNDDSDDDEAASTAAATAAAAAPPVPAAQTAASLSASSRSAEWTHDGFEVEQSMEEQEAAPPTRAEEEVIECSSSSSSLVVVEDAVAEEAWTIEDDKESFFEEESEDSAAGVTLRAAEAGLGSSREELGELWTAYARACASEPAAELASLDSERASLARAQAWRRLLLGDDDEKQATFTVADEEAELDLCAPPDSVLKQMRRDCSAAGARIALDCKASVDRSGGVSSVSTAMLEVVLKYYELYGEYDGVSACEPLFCLHDALSNTAAVAMLRALSVREHERQHEGFRALVSYHSPGLASSLDRSLGVEWTLRPPRGFLSTLQPECSVAVKVRLLDLTLPDPQWLGALCTLHFLLRREQELLLSVDSPMDEEHKEGSSQAEAALRSALTAASDEPAGWVDAALVLQGATPRSFRRRIFGDGPLLLDDGDLIPGELDTAHVDGRPAFRRHKSASSVLGTMMSKLNKPQTGLAPLSRRLPASETLRRAREVSREMERRAPHASLCRLVPRLTPDDVIPSLFGCSSELRYFCVDVRLESDCLADGYFPTARRISPAALRDAGQREALLAEFEALRDVAHIALMGAGAAYLQALGQEGGIMEEVHSVAMCAAIFVAGGFRRVAIVEGGYAACYAALFASSASYALEKEPALGLMEHEAETCRVRIVLKEAGIPLKHPNADSKTLVQEQPDAPTMQKKMQLFGASASAMLTESNTKTKAKWDSLFVVRPAMSTSKSAPFGSLSGFISAKPAQHNKFSIGDDNEEEEAEEDPEAVLAAKSELALLQHKVAGLRKGEIVTFDSASLPDTILFSCHKLKRQGGSAFQRERRVLRCIGINRERLIVFDTYNQEVAVGARALVKSNHHLTELVKLTFPRPREPDVLAIHLRAGFDDATALFKSNSYKIPRHQAFVRRLQERLARFR